MVMRATTSEVEKYAGAQKCPENKENWIYTKQQLIKKTKKLSFTIKGKRNKQNNANNANYEATNCRRISKVEDGFNASIWATPCSH